VAPPHPACQKRRVDVEQYALMDAVEDGMWWYRALHARVASAIAGCAVPGAVLDAGCGTGGTLARLAAAATGRTLFGIEYRAAAAQRAATKSGAAVTAGTVDALPFPDASFAIVTSLDVLSHAAVDAPRALAELRRVLRPGGLLVVNLPAFEWLRSAHDTRVHNARRFTARGAEALIAAAGFQAIRARYWNALLLPLMALHRKVATRAPDARSDVAPFPPWLDLSLYGVTAIERRIGRIGLAFPAGGSLFVTATRPRIPALTPPVA